MSTPLTSGQRSIGGFALLALLTVVWGSSWPVAKLALGEIDPWTFRAMTLIGSAAVLFALTWISGRPILPKRGDWVPLVLVAVFNISAWHLLSAFGLRASDAAHAVIIAYTMPIWATVLGVWLLGEAVRPRSAIALILVMAGLVVLVGGNLETVAGSAEGPLLLLLAALSWAYGTIRQKQLKTELSLTAIAGWQLLLGTVPITAGMVLWGEPEALSGVSSTALAATAIMLAAMVFCYWAWFRVVRIFPAHVASIGTATAPVFGVVASGIILGETLGPEEWGSLSLVVAGLLFLATQNVSRAGRPGTRAQTTAS